jgi:isopenicillin N synthase-like dioxygenase
MPDFTAIPVLDFALIERGEKDRFLQELRNALVNVGFLYLVNPPVTEESFASVVDFAPRLFQIPQEDKAAVAMVNSQHFLGYTNLGTEITKGATDHREQFDFATPHQNQWRPGDPDFLRLWGNAQWPREEVLPGFKESLLKYLDQVEKLSWQFTGLMAEALGLAPNAFDCFFEASQPSMQHRCKVIKYPEVNQDADRQGVGPHYDSGFLTFLVQASDHAGLQVQNFAGEWVDVPPKPNALVVNLGKALETVTQGVALATSHRVLSPLKGSGPRFSIPFFQMIAQRIQLGQMILDMPPDILKLKETRGKGGQTEAVNFSEYGQSPAGEVQLIGRIKSHPDVGERHYPQRTKEIFPQGIPRTGSAY